MATALPKPVTAAPHAVEAAPVEPWIGQQVPYIQALEAKYDFLDRALTQTDITSPNGLFCLEPDKTYCKTGCIRVPMHDILHSRWACKYIATMRMSLLCSP
ncbi:TPA: hypothetical protein ACH3X3_000736 [Trebouxia sp. C0006]